MAARAALAVGLCLAGGCGGSSTTSEEPPGPARLGCHQYCRQTGGFGAPAETSPPMAVLAGHGPVKPVTGLIPVPVTCRFDRACSGALLLTLGETELGRSDLAVPAKGTRVIGVSLSPAGQRAVTRAGRAKVAVTLDTNPSFTALPEAERKHWFPLEVEYLTVIG
jgi:hypothetical protein